MKSTAIRREYFFLLEINGQNRFNRAQIRRSDAGSGDLEEKSGGGECFYREEMVTGQTGCFWLETGWTEEEEEKSNFGFGDRRVRFD